MSPSFLENNFILAALTAHCGHIVLKASKQQLLNAATYCPTILTKYTLNAWLKFQ
jgi:hypothetical protein